MQGQFIGLTSEPSLQPPPHFLKRDVKLLYVVPKSYIGNHSYSEKEISQVTAMVHTFNLRTWPTEASQFISKFKASLFYRVPGQPGLYRETMSRNKHRRSHDFTCILKFQCMPTRTHHKAMGESQRPCLDNLIHELEL